MRLSRSTRFSSKGSGMPFHIRPRKQKKKPMKALEYARRTRVLRYNGMTDWQVSGSHEIGIWVLEGARRLALWAISPLRVMR